MHVSIFVDVQLLIFLIWEMVGPGFFPFFIPVLVGWGAVLAIHYWRKPKTEPVPQTNVVPSTSTPFATSPSLYPQQ